MGVTADFIQHLETITTEAQEIAMLHIIQLNEHMLLDLNTNQLMNGKDSNGVLLEHYHSKFYASFKLTLNPKGVTDLFLEGKFQAGFFANTQKFPVLINSHDDKRNKLVEKYGEEIFGLDQQSKATFRQYCKEAIQRYYKEEVFRS